jgi:hypothetical protein
MFWWEVGGHDPIYAVFIPESVVASSGWSGMHFLAPSLTHAVLPFPLTLFVHDAMPYLVVKVPEAGLNIPNEALLTRDQCAGLQRPSFCTALYSFDKATETAAHEFVETATDPYPFSAWSDLGKVPVWNYGELADICEFSLRPWGSRSRIGNTIVATYWSNLDNACVPESRPTVTILEPQNATTIPWQAGGANVLLRGVAKDPTDGPLTQIFWSVDGHQIGSGTEVRATALALGSHVIVASVTDSSGLTASASATISVSARPPVATISTPTNGATFGTDEILIFRGDGFDYQDGSLPDSSLEWQVNGSVIGRGRLLQQAIINVGDAIVMLTVTNSAGLRHTASLTLHITPPLGNPSIIITQPANLSGFGDDSKPITFTASAHNANGSPIPDSAIRWTDDTDGFLGTGSTLQHTLSSLGCGILEHHVTATAANGAGKTASDTITVYVGIIC